MSRGCSASKRDTFEEKQSFSVNHPNESTSSLSPPDAPRAVWVNVSTEVMEGSSVTLHCEVDSNPLPRISWMFGDQELLWDTTSNISLSLDDVTPAQEGFYTCVGENGYGVMNTSLYLGVKCKSDAVSVSQIPQ